MIKKDVRLEGAASQGALRQSNAEGKTPKGSEDPKEKGSTNSTVEQDDVGEIKIDSKVG